MLKRKYKGVRKAGKSDAISYSEIYYGTKAEVEQYASALNIGKKDATGRYELASWRTSQADGPIHEIELTWERPLSQGVSTIDAAGPTSHSLDVGIMQNPLKKHPDYRTNWDHALLGKDDAALPAWWEEAVDATLSASDMEKYRWVRNPDLVNGMGDGWRLLKERTIEEDFYYAPTYLIRESTLHSSATSAAWAATSDIGRISKPKLGVFGTGIQSWLNLGGQIQPYGKKYLARITYKAAPGEDGWNSKLYGD